MYLAGELMQEFVTASEAATALGVSLKTLYTYASRGLIHSLPVAPDRRDRLYDYREVMQLKQRADQRHRFKAPGARQVGPRRDGQVEFARSETDLHYVGHNLTTFATRHSIEQVAGLLWLGNMESSRELFAHDLGQDKRQAESTERPCTRSA